MKINKKQIKSLSRLIEIFTIAILFIVFLYVVSNHSSILAIFYPPLLVILVYLSKKIKIDLEAFKIISIIIIATSLASWSIVLFEFADIGENILTSTYGDYYFSIDDSPDDNLEISDFKLFINYNSNNGNISFYTFEDYLKKTNNLRIFLPNRLSINKINLTCLKADTKQLYEGENFTADYSKDKRYYIDLNKFKIEEGCSNIYFNIFFEGFIVPNGKFNFRADVRDFYSSNEENIVLIKGPYNCIYPCFSGQKNSEIDITPNEVIISYPKDYFKNNSENSYKILEQEFTINMVNKNIVKDTELKRAFGISLFVGSIFLIAQAIIEFLMFVIKRNNKLQFYLHNN